MSHSPHDEDDDDDDDDSIRRITTERSAPTHRSSRGAAVVVVFLPVADAALGGLTLALLGTGAAFFALTQLILGALPWRSPVPRRKTDAADSVKVGNGD